MTHLSGVIAQTIRVRVAPARTGTGRASRECMHESRNTPLKVNGVRKQRLLIGESNPSVRDYLVAVLGAEGHEVVAMTSGPLRIGVNLSGLRQLDTETLGDVNSAVVGSHKAH